MQAHSAWMSSWSEQVHRNRVAVLKASGASAGPHALARRLAPAPERPVANSGLAPIALVAAVMGGAVVWQREGHKLRGRQLPAWVPTPLRSFLSRLAGSGGRRTTVQQRRPGSGGGSRAPLQPQEQVQQVSQRQLLAAAAEQRMKQQASCGAQGQELIMCGLGREARLLLLLVSLQMPSWLRPTM